jgi:hypothetical protein
MEASGPANTATDDLASVPALAAYGATMLAVQVFELELALLAAGVRIDPHRKPKSTLEREARAPLKPIIHLVLKASPAELRKRLEGEAPPPLAGRGARPPPPTLAAPTRA